MAALSHHVTWISATSSDHNEVTAMDDKPKAKGKARALDEDEHPDFGD